MTRDSRVAPAPDDGLGLSTEPDHVRDRVSSPQNPGGGHSETGADAGYKSETLLRPGYNCWRVEHAGRVAVLVDGEEYFGAVRTSMIKARRRILIAGWDIHSQVELVRDPVNDDFPTRLGALLVALLEDNPELDVYILLWDYASIYALERETTSLGDNPWDVHPRLHFVKDDRHPVSASHHQKLVVIDGTIAYCGGFDLSVWRWDTNAHPAEDPRRRDTDDAPYQPFHDFQMLVDRDAAAALGALFVERWQQALGCGIVPPPDADTRAAPWPDGVAVMLHDQSVGLARTLPEFAGRPEVREVEQLYLDMIERAEQLIYIENQYLTARSVGDALCASLRRETGPQVVIVLPKRTGAWLEQHTMDILRARMLSRLRDADGHDRLRVYYPDVAGLEDGCLMVHAKFMIVDDRVLRVGSSNLSNRSMGLDTECDLCVVVERDEEIAAIRALRQRVLAIFLSVEPEQVSQAEAHAREQGDGIIQAIETLRAMQSSSAHTPSIRLADLDGEVDPEWDHQLPDERIIDPDRPIDGDLVTDVVVGDQEHVHHLRWRLVLGAGVLVVFVTLAAAWRWTALGDWLSPETIASAVSGLGTTLWGPPAALIAFMAAALVAVPVTLLILVAALVFGPFIGGVVALSGSLLSALAGYALGSYLGRSAVERMTGGLERLSRRFARHGILTVVTVRIVPVAPFAVINLFAGASHLRLRDFMIGTAIGMTPAIVAMSIFAEGLISLIGQADLRAVALVLVGVLAIVGLAWYGRRMLASDA